MLNERVYKTERFATEELSTVTVSSELLKVAANDGLNTSVNAASSQQRRLRRQPLSATSPIGGWKVRMW